MPAGRVPKLPCPWCAAGLRWTREAPPGVPGRLRSAMPGFWPLVARDMGGLVFEASSDPAVHASHVLCFSQAALCLGFGPVCNLPTGWLGFNLPTGRLACIIIEFLNIIYFWLLVRCANPNPMKTCCANPNPTTACT